MEETHAAGESGEPDQGAGPGDFCGYGQDGVGSAELLAVGEKEFQFADDFTGWNSQKRGNARVLQRCYRQTAFAKNR